MTFSTCLLMTALSPSDRRLALLARRARPYGNTIPGAIPLTDLDLERARARTRRGPPRPAHHRRLEFLLIVATVVVAVVPANLENNQSVWFLLGWLAAARPLLIVPGRMMHPRLHTEPLIVRRPAVAKAMGVTDADARTNG